jgi:hypothetical protein
VQNKYYRHHLLCISSQNNTHKPIKISCWSYCEVMRATCISICCLWPHVVLTRLLKLMSQRNGETYSFWYIFCCHSPSACHFGNLLTYNNNSQSKHQSSS